jgi:hypothetical protein
MKLRFKTHRHKSMYRSERMNTPDIPLMFDEGLTIINMCAKLATTSMAVRSCRVNKFAIRVVFPDHCCHDLACFEK